MWFSHNIEANYRQLFPEIDVIIYSFKKGITHLSATLTDAQCCEMMIVLLFDSFSR